MSPESKMPAPLIMRIVSLSVKTAQCAGGIIRDIMTKGDLRIVDKGKDDPQTEADRSAQRCIIASLTKEFPNLKIIGEEGYSNLNVVPDWIVSEYDPDILDLDCPSDWVNASEEDFVVWVDPLDGTSEYTQGFLEHVTVLIGVAIKSSAVGGIIHQPYYKNPSGALGRTIWGIKGIGTFGFEPKDPPVGKFIVTTTRSHSNPIVQSALDALKPTEVIKVGGAGYKVLQLLDGKAHAYVFASAGCKKWDTCAPEAVIESQGGQLTDILGAHYSYNADVEYPNKRGVLATVRGVSHSEIVSKLPDSVKKAMEK